MKIIFTRIRAISYQQVFLLLFILIACGSSNNLQAQCSPGTANCATLGSFVSLGTGATPSCAGQSYNLGAGTYYTVPFVSGVVYNFTFTNSAESNGIDINGTQYTTSNFNLSTLSGSLVVGSWKTNTTWTGTSAVLAYKIVTPSETVAGAGTYCGSAAVTCTPTNGSAYWQTVSGGTSVTSGTSNPETSQTATSSGTYYYNTDNGGCWSGTSSVAVTIDAQPTAPSLSSASPANGTYLCIGDNGPSAIITPGTCATGTVSTWYQYSINNGGAWSTSTAYTTGATVGPINTTGGSTNAIIRAYTTSNGSNCVASATTNIVTWPLVAQPTVSITTSTGNTEFAALCADEASGTTLTATNSNGTGPSGPGSGETWQWQIYDTLTSGWVNISGATGSTLNPNTLTTANTGAFYNGWSKYNPAQLRVQDTWSGAGCAVAYSNATYVAPYPPAPVTSGNDITSSTNITGCGGAEIYGLPVLGSNYSFDFYSGTYSGTHAFLASGSDYIISTVGSASYFVSTVGTLTGCNGYNDAAANTTAVTVTVSPSFPLSFTNPNSSSYDGYGVKCYGTSDGQITATDGATSPNYPLSFSWSTGTDNTGVMTASNTIPSSASLAAGTYTVTVTDNGGCVEIGSYTLTSPAAVTATTSTTSLGLGYGTNCYGATDGTATVTPGGGVGGGTLTNYTYSWSPSGGSSYTTGATLGAGIYDVTVTDANSCSTSASAVITQPSAISFTTPIGYVCNSGGTGYASATVTVAATGGASGVYSYSISPTTGVTQSGNVFSGLSNSTTYTITVKDAAYTSCTTSGNVTITFPSVSSAGQTCNFIYVSSSGGGTLANSTCPTDIITALTNPYGTGLIQTGRTVLLLEAGTYTITQTLSIPANVTLDGGYSIVGGNWVKSSTAGTTTLNINPVATNNGTTGYYIGLLAAGNGFMLKDLTINVQSGGAVSTYNNYGQSVYGLYDGTYTGFTLSRCYINTGAGSAGASATAYSGSGGAGGGGTASGTAANGGGECSGSSTGNAGGNGAGYGGSYGYGGGAGGTQGPGCNSVDCDGSQHNGYTGGNGETGQPGSGYTAGSPAGTPTPTTAYFTPGQAASGGNGGGGGGGGQGGGGVGGTCVCFSCGGSTEVEGGSGGAGGAGGLGGPGGYGGGGSFDIYIYGAGSGTVLDCDLSPGAGGAGGSGATGQSGTTVSNNGSGGGCDGCVCQTVCGGTGGSGGSGGNGGRGQDGAYGPSTAIVTLNGGSVTSSHTGTANTVPADGNGAITASWYSGCLNSEITITKPSASSWTNIGSNPYYEDNLTSSSSSYSNTTNTAVIYYNSGSGNQNISTNNATFSDFIDLIGTRLTPVTGVISTPIASPCPGSSVTLTNTLTTTQAGNVVTYEWEILNTSGTVLYTSNAAGSSASPLVVSSSSITGGLVAGTTYLVRLRLQEQCCGWSIPIWSTFTVNSVPVAAGAISPITATCPGSSVTYSISSVANTTGYTWSVSGGVIAANGLTSYSANVTTVTINWGPAGTGTVSVVPYNGCGNAATTTHQNITIDGSPVPSIIVNPTTSTSICTGGGSVQLQANTIAGAGGGGPFNYTWSGGLGTANPLTVTPGTGVGPYTYTVSVTDQASGCSASVSQVITVTAQPTVTAPTPSSQTVCTTGTIGSVSASPTGGAGTFGYQWYSSNTNVNATGSATNLGSANGAQTASYTPPATGTSGTKYYFCVITNNGQGCNSVTTPLNDAAVTVDPQPSIVTPAANTSICPGGTTSMSVAVSGGVSIVGYNWQYNNSGTWQSVTANSPANITYSGGNTSTLTINSTSSVSTGTYSYQCIITFSGTGCTATLTTSALLTVSPQPAISSQPGIALMCQGGSGTLQVVTTGGVNPQYTWSYYNGSTYVPITTAPANVTYSGINSNILDISAANNSSTGSFYYECNITYVAGTGCTPNSLTTQAYPAYSTTGVAEIGLQPSIVTQPTSVAVCEPGSSSLSTAGTNGTVLSYQWQYYNSGTSTWVNASDNAPSGITYSSTETSTTLDLAAAATTAPAAYQYRCQVTSLGNNCLTTYTNTVTFTVNAPPTAAPSSNSSVCYSGTIMLYANAVAGSNNTLSYTWSGPNAFSSGSPSPTRSAAGNGGTYDVTVEDANLCSVTGSTTVNIYPSLVITTALAGCMFEDSAHANFPGTVDSDMIVVNASGGSGTYTFGSTTPGSELRNVVSAGENVFTVPANALSYSFTALDANGCSVSSSILSLSSNPTNIPYTGLGIHGSETVTCYDKTGGFGKWLTFIDPSNNAVLEINDNNQDLGLVSVTVYKDKTSMHIQESGTGCPNTYESPMQRHYVVTSNVAQPFAKPVTVRLYFNNTELDSLEKAEQADDNGLFCSTFGAVNSLSDLYVTKYDDPFVHLPGYQGYMNTGTTEDSLYTNNITGGNGGIFTVYGSLTQFSTDVAGPLLKDSLGFDSIYPGSYALDNYVHLVQLKVTSFSELWLNGAQYYTEPLPVNLIYLEAEGVDNTYIQVSWATAQEINNNHFTIERSTDSQNWDSIGIVQGHGTTTIESDYTFNDNNVVPNINFYYRLKQVDDNGNYTYTDVVNAEIYGQATFNIKGFIPNPTNGSTSLVITTSKSVDVTVQVFNILGQDITAAQNHHLAVGSNQLDFDFRSLASGTYTAVLTSGNEVYTKRLVITK